MRQRCVRVLGHETAFLLIDSGPRLAIVVRRLATCTISKSDPRTLRTGVVLDNGHARANNYTVHIFPPAEHSDRRLAQEDEPLCGGRRLRQQGGQDQPAPQEDGLGNRKQFLALSS